MQIFDDEKKRIGTLSGYRERSITTTLDSGDKELSFEYPANGKMTEMLKEEYYLRTKTDEFVLKSVEKGEQFNKYTAVLNVEELEGMAFPYGFESQEQTIRACLEFAFEDTGWTIGICTVTKKRTINEDGSVTAWDVLQKCLSTYRCECVIDSINKVIDIYEQIGCDKGCYFIEGLNLRKLSPKSDTYDFFTRIYPIGKDGITPEWLLGKDYIDNHQYSKKVKAFVWRDERYTNTTSLIEDATAKLEEVSKPYKSFTAEVADLAKASEKYKDVLSYGIGDIITLISKTYQTREKQRIVKITEYPENIARNTVEISNARKTFAQIQQEETESAKAEAISISNKTTKKILANYTTTEEVETRITASKENIELGVKQTLESYYDKTETNAQIELSKGEIELSVSKTYQTKDDMGEYSTTEEMNAQFEITAQQISSKVTKGEISSQISQEADLITISSDRFVLDSTNCKISADGSIEAKNATITGGCIDVKAEDDEWVLVTVATENNKSEMSASNYRIEDLSSGDILSISQKKIEYREKTGTNKYSIDKYVDFVNNRMHFGGAGYFDDFVVGNNFRVDGTKSRAVSTSDFGKVLEYCYEMTCPVFGDIGSGIIAGDGYCYIYLDPVFTEAIANNDKYQVFLQKEGEGDLWVEEKHADCIVVKGTCNLKFSWEIKAKQRNYENTRQESADGIELEKDINYDGMWSMELEKDINYDEMWSMELEKYEEEVTNYEH